MTSVKNKAHKPFELNVLETYFGLLKARNMVQEDMFNLADKDQSGQLDLNEMQSYLVTISPDL